MNELPTHKQATQYARLERKAREQAGVAKPQYKGDCWAEKRVYAGQMFPSYVQCSKPARKGFLTCYWHRDRENAAQMIAGES